VVQSHLEGYQALITELYRQRARVKIFESLGLTYTCCHCSLAGISHPSNKDVQVTQMLEADSIKDLEQNVAEYEVKSSEVMENLYQFYEN
jgi:DNA-directed RNA polymerase subunit N (RpoN/RPB10)